MVAAFLEIGLPPEEPPALDGEFHRLAEQFSDVLG